MVTRFYDVGLTDGFDGDAAPPFQMVPNGDTRIAHLENGEGMDVRAVTPGVIELEEVPAPPTAVKNLRIFKLKGLMVGKTFIEVRKSSRLMARLEVVVTSLISFTVSFNYLSDRVRNGNGSWTTLHKTNRAKDDIDEMVRHANYIFTDQANIKIVKRAVRDAVVDHNLGDVIRFSAHLPGVPSGEHEWDVVGSKRDRTATFNVFFVWEYEQDKNFKQDQTDGASSARIVMIEDNLGGDAGRILAHELGHCMGLDNEHNSKKADEFLMMYGYRLRKNEILAMRRVLARILKLTGT